MEFGNVSRACKAIGLSRDTVIFRIRQDLDAMEESLPEAAKAARAGADRTAHMSKANAGRASYVNAKHLVGHADPGAEAVARLFEHLA